MNGRERSFHLKADRAEKHLMDVESEIARYTDSRPYAVSVMREGKQEKPVYRLTFTSQPDPHLSLIVADCIHNMRSGLDHLAAALVPAAVRRSVMFPIFFQGVWEAAVEGENEQRLKERQRWTQTTRHMPAGAVAVLMTIQPSEGWERSEDEVPAFALLNRLANADRHTKLPILTRNLRKGTLSFTYGNTRLTFPSDQIEGEEALHDDGEIGVPDGAADVEVEGTPLVAIGIGQPQWYIAIPDGLRIILSAMRDVIRALEPFVP